MLKCSFSWCFINHSEGLSPRRAEGSEDDSYLSSSEDEVFDEEEVRIDVMLLHMGTFLRPEALHGLALISQNFYKHLSPILLCSALFCAC